MTTRYWTKLPGTAETHKNCTRAALKAPNAWGLYDMAGNISEFCHDYFVPDISSGSADPTGPSHGEDVAVRGGSYVFAAGGLRAAIRFGFGVNSTISYHGFRTAQSITQPECSTDADCSTPQVCHNNICSDRTCEPGTMVCTASGSLDVCEQDGDRIRRIGQCSCGCNTEQTGCAPCILADMIAIEPGEFAMGSPTTERDRGPDETLHPVEITRAFSLLRTEVSQGLWFRTTGTRPAHRLDYDGAVNQVSAQEAYEFLNRLSLLYGREPCYLMIGCTMTTPGGRAPFRCESVEINTPSQNPLDCEGFRLPTEAEWEFAYRAGTQTPYYNGDYHVSGCEFSELLAQIAWYCGSDEGEDLTRQIGTLQPNNLGLYDMAGNVREMCGDRYSPHISEPAVDPIGRGTLDSIVLKGGYQGPAYDLRAAARSSYSPRNSDRNTGFRIALSGHQLSVRNME